MLVGFVFFRIVTLNLEFLQSVVHLNLLTNDQRVALLVRALVGTIVLCSWVTHATL